MDYLFEITKKVEAFYKTTPCPDLSSVLGYLKSAGIIGELYEEALSIEDETDRLIEIYDEISKIIG